MRIAHLADLHLGYRAYHRQARGGMNQRERDVAEAAGRAVDQVVAASPDVVLVAGDVFHTVRPPNAAIMDGFRLFMRLRHGLPGTPVVIIAGNHDSPRSADSGSILRLLSEIPEIHVVDAEARTVRLDGGGVAVHCLPHQALIAGAAAEAEPDPTAGVNVLMLHGTVTGTGVDERLLRLVEYGGAQLERSALREDDWDYVALGHYHDATRIAPNVWYAGATEHTVTNVWAEAGTRKGWVLFDVDRGEGEFRDVRTREVVDLPRFGARAADGSWLPAEEVNARINDAVAALSGGVAGKIVRQVITDMPRELLRQLDHGRIRALKAEAVHFQVDARRPDSRAGAVGDDLVADRRRLTLEQELERFLSTWRTTAPGIELERLLVLGSEYLSAAEDWREQTGSGGADFAPAGPEPAAPAEDGDGAGGDGGRTGEGNG